MKNKQVKQMMCDALKSTNGDTFAFVRLYLSRIYGCGDINFNRSPVFGIVSIKACNYEK